VTVAHGSTIVREVISSTSSGADVMSALPGLVRQLLDEEAWREFTAPGGRIVRHGTFGAFVLAEPPDGLGGRRNQLAALCGTDEELATRIRALLREEIPKAQEPHRPGATDKHGGTILPRDEANTADRITARLKRDDPDLAEKVVRGEVTPNAAAREKGWRKPRIIVSSPEAVAHSLLKYMSADDIAKLVAVLLGVPERDEAAVARQANGL
jgi:hypothetical protein